MPWQWFQVNYLCAAQRDACFLTQRLQQRHEIPRNALPPTVGHNFKERWEASCERLPSTHADNPVLAAEESVKRLVCIPGFQHARGGVVLGNAFKQRPELHWTLRPGCARALLHAAANTRAYQSKIPSLIDTEGQSFPPWARGG